MAANPRIVTEDVIFRWDGVPQRLGRGQLLDVTPGSALEKAIGAQRLRPVGAVAAQPPAEQEAAPEEEPKAEEPGTAPAKARSTAKKQDSDEKDGNS